MCRSNFGREDILSIACVIYVEFACHLLQGFDLEESYRKTQAAVNNYYKDEPELAHFHAILNGNMAEFTEEEIQSSGYVVHTLEASLWCLFNSVNYVEAVLKAVNLGEDTDTTGAVTGGLAGIYYGLSAIPGPWIDVIARKEDIIDLAERLAEKLASA
nr:ADP-ribosylglycohydrolase family protein [Paenibacillus marchantiophytorum]